MSTGTGAVNPLPSGVMATRSMPKGFPDVPYHEPVFVPTTKSAPGTVNSVFAEIVCWFTSVTSA